jgi:hypothetical protein
MEQELSELGQVLRRAQDEQPLELLDFTAGRARLLAERAAPARRFRGRWALAAAALVSAIAIAVVASSVRGSSPLAFHVDAGRAPGQVGEWVAAPAERDVKLSFDDGSVLDVLANARARVTQTDVHGATVVLERGRLKVSVVHQAGTDWRVDVGPFQVHVTGTRFEVGWQPELERLSLTMTEGSVVIEGPTFEKARRVVAGETVTLSPKPEPEQLPVAAQEGVTPARRALDREVPLETASALPTTQAPGLASSRHSAPAAQPSLTSFRERARDNDYERALAAAEQTGFAQICATASDADLLLLGDTARLAGSPARAEEAYDAVRRRFRGASAAQAAFLLGRLAFEARSAYADAARFFALSLLEAPSGPFARDAEGRLFESLERSGDIAGARAAAQRYLERYPEGPHASLAKALLGVP